MIAEATDDAGDLAADLAKVEALRRSLGAQLATYRTAAGVSQPRLGRALGKTRSMISKVENGTRGLPGACHYNCVSPGWTKIGRCDYHLAGKGTICDSGRQRR